MYLISVGCNYIDQNCLTAKVYAEEQMHVVLNYTYSRYMYLRNFLKHFYHLVLFVFINTTPECFGFFWQLYTSLREGQIQPLGRCLPLALLHCLHWKGVKISEKHSTQQPRPLGAANHRQDTAAVAVPDLIHAFVFVGQASLEQPGKKADIVSEASLC